MNDNDRLIKLALRLNQADIADQLKRRRTDMEHSRDFWRVMCFAVSLLLAIQSFNIYWESL